MKKKLQHYFKTFFNATLPAFSLLEVSVVLCIMGIILSYAIPNYTHLRVAAKLKETDKKLENLMYVLSSYAALNGALPFAAPPYNTSQAHYHGKTAPPLLTGIVPYLSLNISEKDAKDGFGNFITYAVAYSAVSAQSSGLPIISDQNHPSYQGGQNMHNSLTNAFCEKKPINHAQSSLQVETPSGTVSEMGLHQDFLAVVLISHGPSGPSRDMDYHKEILRSPSKQQNSRSLNRIFKELPFSKTFDERVRWVTRNNLMAIYAKTPCITVPSRPSSTATALGGHQTNRSMPMAVVR